MPHTHHANNKPSVRRQAVSGSIPLHAAVAMARAIPPSMHTAWLMHALLSGMSSFKVATFRPKSTQGQNNPVRPIFREGDQYPSLECDSRNSGCANHMTRITLLSRWLYRISQFEHRSNLHRMMKTTNTSQTRSASYISHQVQYANISINWTDKRDS